MACRAVTGASELGFGAHLTDPFVLNSTDRILTSFSFKKSSSPNDFSLRRSCGFIVTG